MLGKTIAAKHQQRLLAAKYDCAYAQAANTNGDEFGEHRVLEIARAHRHLSMPLLVEKLVEAARVFSHPEQADDITVVAARCRE